MFTFIVPSDFTGFPPAGMGYLRGILEKDNFNTSLINPRHILGLDNLYGRIFHKFGFIK